jgi:hypothetical protein
MMNQRIRELAHEAGLPTYNPEGIPTKLEKFAELIVMECLTICEELGDQGLDGHYCADEIKRTFGVK